MNNTDNHNTTITYNPIINYNKDYYSEKEIKDDITYIITEKDKDINKTDELLDLIDKIDSLIVGLPDDLKDVVENVYDPIKDFIDNNKDYLEDEFIKEDEDDEIEDDNDVPILTDDDDNFIPQTNIIYNDTNTLENLINKYKENYTDLFKDYFEKLNSILSNYWINIGNLLIGKPSNYKEFMLTDINKDFTTSKDKQHMLDFSMRSQIHRKSKTSFVSKMYPVNETLTILKDLKLSTDLMVRYLKLDIKDLESEFGYVSQTVLESCLLNYSNKYNHVYKNTYKYLNSSVKLTDDLFQLSVQEMKSKQFLK